VSALCAILDRLLSLFFVKSEGRGTTRDRGREGRREGRLCIYIYTDADGREWRRRGRTGGRRG